MRVDTLNSVRPSACTTLGHHLGAHLDRYNPALPIPCAGWSGLRSGWARPGRVVPACLSAGRSSGAADFGEVLRKGATGFLWCRDRAQLGPRGPRVHHQRSPGHSAGHVDVRERRLVSPMEQSHAGPDHGQRAPADSARHFFSVAEVEDLNRLPSHLQAQGFFSCWTRKEACVKACGEGLGIPLASVCDTAAARRWSRYTIQPAPGYIGAVVVEGSGWRLRQWHWQGSAACDAADHGPGANVAMQA